MTKAEIVDEISKNLSLTKKDIGFVIDLFIKNMNTWIPDDEHIELRGFGTFGTKVREQRTARNPKNNEKIHIPKHKVVYFKPGKELKDKVRHAKFKEEL